MTASKECCMCGDCGLSYELFRCTVCQFRSQHRYCSNLYPKAESYSVCNWCLIRKEDRDSTADKTQNYSSNSSSSGRNNSADDANQARPKGRNSPKRGGVVNVKAEKRIGLQLQSVNSNSSIKKQRSPEGSPSPMSPAGRKRVIKRSCDQENLRRTKSEEISNGGIVAKPLFRNKVRRYKLLDEVSSQ